MRGHCLHILILALALAAAVPRVARADDLDPFLGRWDLEVLRPDGARWPSWIEVTRSGNRPRLQMVEGMRRVFPTTIADIDRGDLVWKVIEVRNLVSYRIHLQGDRLMGTVSVGEGPSATWAGQRAPRWPTQKSSLRRRAGETVVLFNGKNLTGWHPADKGSYVARDWLPTPGGGDWIVADGAMVSRHRSGLYSLATFDDLAITVEFSLAAGSDSGILLRGRYELALEDGRRAKEDVIAHGAIHGFVPPLVDSSRAAGEWQVLQATLIGNVLNATLNGKRIHRDYPIPGLTGGALDSHEHRPGPIMLQGHPNGVRYRRIEVTRLLPPR